MDSEPRTTKRARTEPQLPVGASYTPAAVDLDESVALYETLRENIPWYQMKWRGKPLPRFVWHYEIGVCPPLDAFMRRFCESRGIAEFGLFCNYYRTGNDYAPHHKDVYGADVISVSLGATRTFCFKDVRTKEVVSIPMHSGDAVSFAQTVNDTHTHSLIKEPRVANGRINLTIFVRRE